MKESEKWLEVMNLAEKYGFIIQSYGGVAVLATKKERDKVNNEKGKKHKKIF